MPVPDKVKTKLQALPDKPGVYLMRDKNGRIIYVGKAVSLRNRVRHYFQAGTRRSAAPKLRSLIHSIADFDILVSHNEADAILAEGRMIKEYRPRFNVAFRDDKRFLMLRIRLDDPFPRLETCRMDKNDGATCFGPYSNSGAARAALEFTEKKFGLRQCRPLIPGPEDHQHCHNDIIRFCSAPCIAKITREGYAARVAEACAFLRGERPDVLQELEAAMTREAEAQNFEKAAALRDTLLLLRSAIKQRARGAKSLQIESAEACEGLAELQTALALPEPPRVIECFDISNISGTHAVASMVVAVDGIPAPQRYRHFRIRTVESIDDPAMMAEVIRRRYTRVLAEQQPLPNLVLVDGGVTQLGAARRELAQLGLAAQPSAGLAKRFEELVVSEKMSDPPVRLPADSNGLKVVTRLRDEAHRFALTFHRGLRLRRIRESALDEVAGIGEKRKQILLKHFGSVARLRRATEEEIAAVPGVGPVMAKLIRSTLAAMLLLLAAPTFARAATSTWNEVAAAGMDLRLETPRARAVLDAPEFSWRHAETEHFVVHFENGIFAAKVARMAEFFQTAIAEDLRGLEDRANGRSHIFIFRNPADWKQFLSRSGTGVAAWTFSFVEGPVMYLQPTADLGSSAGVLSHEMAHLVINRFMAGELPLWLNEGLAEWYGEFAYAEFKGVKKSRRGVFRALPKTWPIRETLRARSYPRDARKVDEFYQQSKYLVGFLQLEKPEAFASFVADLAAGGALDTALTRHYGFLNDAEFEKAFWKFAR